MKAICIGNGQLHDAMQIEAERCKTLNCMQDPMKIIGGGTEQMETVVRRLTPRECERLQGFPERKEWDVRKMTKDEFIALNLAEGNLVVNANEGKVFRTRGPGGMPLAEPKEVKGSELANGYLATTIVNNGVRFQCRLHRIVWISQYGVIPDGYCIDHINNDKKDNRISNLQLLTNEENSTKAAKDGLYLSGDDNPASKISQEEREEISFIYHHSDYTQRQLAAMYGISKSRVGQIVNTIGWCDIGDWTDEKGKVHKESDTPKYKALGNSVAIPFWFWLLRRISAEYETPATMGSLFSGIGGFDLAWSRCNGSGSVLWSSEIESYPIAVMRKHFGDEDLGIEGDIRKYL